MSSSSPGSLTTDCCPEYAAMSRRGLFRGALLAGATTVVGTSVITAAPALAAESDATLVVLSMRGAADGLSLVVPYQDSVYYSSRPVIAVPRDQLLAQDGTFGLHPNLAPLLPLWESGRLAAIHATGLPAPNRSHFAAMEEVEDANPGSTVRQGWLNRLLGQYGSHSPLQGFAMGNGMVPTSLYGDELVMSTRNTEDVEIAGNDKWDEIGGRMKSLKTIWGADSSPLGRSVRTTFSAIDGFTPAREAVSNKAKYPSGDLGPALASVAQIVRGNIGAQVITVDHGDWDMHSDLGTLGWGRMRENAKEFALSLAAFFDDLGTQSSKVTVVAFSEFGRRVAQNSSNGLDHGYGNVMFVAGAGVKGGKYYGTLPPLTGDLDSDVPVTTDYRSVLSEVVTSRFRASTATVFPNFAPESVGVMTGV